MNKRIELAHFTDFLKNKNLKRKTIKEYCYYHLKFTKDHFQLNMESVNNFLSDQTNRNAPSRAFLKLYISFLKINRKFYQIEDERYQDLVEIELPSLTGRAKIRIPRYLSEEKINLLEENLNHEREKLCLLISYWCGLRLGELVKIGVNDFNWDKWTESEYKDYGEVRVFGKGDKEGIALVPPFLMTRIAAYIHSTEWYEGKDKLFLLSRVLTNIDGQVTRWQKKLREAGKKSGISSVSEGGHIIEGTQVHPHLLRHSYGASLIEKGVDIRKIQELLRHTDLSSTQIYTHLETKQLKEELKGKSFGIGENHENEVIELKRAPETCCPDFPNCECNKQDENEVKEDLSVKEEVKEEITPIEEPRIEENDEVNHLLDFI